jgi:hypothetical protein
VKNLSIIIFALLSLGCSMSTQTAWNSNNKEICHPDGTCCQRTSDYTSICASGEGQNRLYVVQWDIVKK